MPWDTKLFLWVCKCSEMDTVRGRSIHNLCLWKELWPIHCSQGSYHAPIWEQVGITVGRVGNKATMSWDSTTEHLQV